MQLTNRHQCSDKDQMPCPSLSSHAFSCHSFIFSLWAFMACVSALSTRLIRHSAAITAALFVSLLGAPAQAQPIPKTFSVTHAPYYATIQSESCQFDLANVYASPACAGFGTVKLYDLSLYELSNEALLATLTSEDLIFELDEQLQPSPNPYQVMPLYDEQSPLIFGDFNFDRQMDVAVRNGNNSGYGGPSYDIYLKEPDGNGFELSEEFTALNYENLGMFGWDEKQRQIETFSKSGCCWHQTRVYTYIPGKGLLMIHELTEDATVNMTPVAGEGGMVKITEKALKNGQWRTTETYVPIDEYYP